MCFIHISGSTILFFTAELAPHSTTPPNDGVRQMPQTQGGARGRRGQIPDNFKSTICQVQVQRGLEQSTAM